MLIPVLSTAAGPALAATTSGSLKVDSELVTGIIAPAEEATYNSENGGGIRFATNINLQKLEDLKAFCKTRFIKVITVGTLIAPVDYIEEAGEFSKDALDALGHKTAYLDFKANMETFYEGEGSVAEGYDERFVASIMNVKLENRTRDFAAIGYIQLTLAQGFYTIYSYDNEDMDLVQKYAANIAEVAEKELEKDTLTEEQRAMLTDLAAEEQTLQTTSEIVTDVRVKRNQVFFTYGKGESKFYNRITYDGANGWRLQTNTQNYNKFKDIGAGQSLAMYMREGFNDVAAPLTVTQEDGKLIITTEGADSKAELSLDSFSLDFCNGEGESLYNVSGMLLVDGGKIKMTGKMNATDAVYGGGERFNTTNQRGQNINLYISDAYDLKNSTASYVAIPLFSTSRGGGMFINRYEPMTVSFPQNNMAGNWTLILDAEIADCYFYATGEIADVLQAYVDLTGHASLPEEWAQGYLVCRFSPDLVSLGGQSGNGDGQYWYYKIEDIPDYSKYSYSILVKMTTDNVNETKTTVNWNGKITLENGDTLVSKDGKKTYYEYVVSGSKSYFQSTEDSNIKYNTVAELPNDVEYYLGGSYTDSERPKIVINSTNQAPKTVDIKSQTTLKTGDTIVSKDGKETYYKYFAAGATPYFQSTKDANVKYNTIAELPDGVNYYLAGNYKDDERPEIIKEDVILSKANATVSWSWDGGEGTFTMKNGSTVVNWDGSETYYKYVVSGSTAYFQSLKDSAVRYNSFAELPTDVEYYLGGDSRDRKNLEIGDVLPHKKALTEGGSAVYYHYIIEGPNDDFNYNNIKGESYFLRTSSKGGPSGAGVAYVVDSLIDAGMTPTGVILEGIKWYDSSSQRAKIKEITDYLHKKNIKTLVYSYLGWVEGGSSMGSGYKSEYLLSANVYKYDTVNKKIKVDENGEPILEKKITAIPKSDKTDNPDTASDGTQNYLDITNPNAVKWYIDTVWTTLLDLGVDGVKIDFCESIPNEGYYTNIKNVGEGYIEYNWYDPTMFEGSEVHHAYPSFLASVLYAEMEKRAALRDGDTGFVLLTRGGGIGAQRNPYMWAGDQTRRFRTLGLQLKAVINSGISGLPFMSYDMSGYAYYYTNYNYYGGQTNSLHWPVESGGQKFYLADQQAAEEYESEIFVRALQYTAFGNLIQTHGDVRHVYQMTKEAQEISALYTALHDELSDYLHELSKVACDTGMPMIRHMILQYQNDANVASIDDQFMYGDGLLVAPILDCNTKTDKDGNTVLDYASTVTREVYLPAGKWIDLNTGETIISEGQTVTVTANLAKIPVYLNTASAYAAELQEIFAGETWTSITALANAQ